MKSLLEKLIVVVLAVCVFAVIYSDRTDKVKASDQYYTGSTFKIAGLNTGAPWLPSFDSTDNDQWIEDTQWTNSIYIYDTAGNTNDAAAEYFNNMLLKITLTQIGYYLPGDSTEDSGKIVFELYGSQTDTPYTYIQLLKIDSMLDPSVNDTIRWLIRDIDSVAFNYLAMKMIYTDSTLVDIGTAETYYDTVGLRFDLYLFE